MKVLILGNSDASGAFSTGKTWSEVGRDLLTEQYDTPVTLQDVPFSVEAPTAVSYAEKKVLQAQPDAIIFLVGSFAFTAGFTWVRVESLLGKRAGRWFRELEMRFDGATRHRGVFGTRVNVVARKAVRRIIGTKPLATREAVTASCVSVITALSRNESTPVILISYPGRGAHAMTTKAKAERKLFFAAVEAAAAEHRCRWISGEEAFAAVPADVKVHGFDELHFIEAGHQRLGEVMAAAISESVASGKAGAAGARD